MKVSVAEIANPECTVSNVHKNGNNIESTMTNSGSAGLSRLELFFLEEVDTPLPSQSALFGGDDDPALTFVTAKTVSFDSQETKEIRFTRTDLTPPAENIAVLPITASYTGVIENTGGSGEIEVEFDADSDLVDNPPRKQREIDSGEEIRVQFDVVIPVGTSFSIGPHFV
jgi:hypothetical protein